MSALRREWINDQAERVTLEAPELRPVDQVPCIPTSTGLLIVGAAIGIAIAYLVPWLWSFIKPLIHALTA